MGWLKDAGAEVSISSLAKMARQICQLARATGDDDHVANMLRKLDKGEEVGWWEGAGRRFMEPLAEVLGEAVDDLRVRIASLGHLPGEDTRYWTFDVFPALRALDLVNERLPPGIPDEVTRRSTAPLWWEAPPGAGRTLVGRWLAQRGWAHVRLPTWDAAKATDLEPGLVYVELGQASGPPPEFELPGGQRLIVAAPPPDPGRADGAPGSAYRGPDSSLLTDDGVDETPFTVVRSPPPDRWLVPLVRWAEARIQPGGGFDAPAILKHLDVYGFEAFTTPGDFLAFLGLVDKVGVDALFVHDEAEAERWVKTWLRAAVERTDRRLGGGMSGLLRRDGVATLVNVEMSRITAGEGARLSRDRWERHVPRDLAPELDRDRLRALVDDPAALRAALEAPSPKDVVDALVEIGALSGEPDLGLAPSWVGHVVSSLAAERLRATVDGMGALFLHRETAALLLAELVREVGSGDLAAVQAVLTSPGQTPERLAALDGAVRAVGLALARGTSVDVTVVQALWDRQRCQLVDRWHDTLPVPLVRIAEPSPSNGMSGYGSWALAALAITRALGNATGPYAIWKGVPDAHERERALAAVRWLAQLVLTETLGVRGDLGEEYPVDAEIERTALSAFAMGPALLRAIPELGEANRVFRLLDPAILLARLAGGAPPPTDGSERLPFGLDVLDHVCAHEGVEANEVIRWCWPSWVAQPWAAPFVGWAREGRGEWVRRVLSARPPTVSMLQFRDVVLQRGELWPLLGEADWRDLLAEGDLQTLHHDRIWAAVPGSVLVGLFETGRSNPWTHELRREAWARARPALLTLIDAWARESPPFAEHYPGDPGELSSLLYAAPSDAHDALLDRAEAWLARPQEYAGINSRWTLRWLARLVDDRGSSWRRAFRLVRPTTDGS